MGYLVQQYLVCHGNKQAIQCRSSLAYSQASHPKDEHKKPVCRAELENYN